MAPVKEMKRPARTKDQGHCAYRQTGVTDVRLQSAGQRKNTCVYYQYGEKRKIFHVISLFFDFPFARDERKKRGAPPVWNEQAGGRGSRRRGGRRVTGGNIRPMLR
jgi:hypothetical protein